MISKTKLIKRAVVGVGLSAVPAAAALGLTYGIKDVKVNFDLAPAKDYGERYFDDKIVKVNDDDFASSILHETVAREGAKTDQSYIDSKSGDLTGLIRLDRDLDSQYARSVIAMDSEFTNEGSISVDDGLVYDFHGIKEIVKKKSGSRIFGKDVIKAMESDAQTAIQFAINKHKKDKGLKSTDPLRVGIFFEKNVIARTVSIFLYELEDFNKDQNDVINKFIKKIDSVDVDHQTAQQWANNFRYNIYNQIGAGQTPQQLEKSHDTINGVKTTATIPDFNSIRAGGNGTTSADRGFLELFGGSNLMNTDAAINWYSLGGIEPQDELDLGVTHDGKIGISDFNRNVITDPNEWKTRYPTYPTNTSLKLKADDIINRINKSEYINFSTTANNIKPVLNIISQSQSPSIIGPIQFVEKGIIPLIEPNVDFKNHLLKIKYTFKAFRKLGTEKTRSIGNFGMDTHIENPYKICTYVKEIPLDYLGNEGESGEKPKIKLSASTKKFKPFYTDATSNLDIDKPGYDSLKNSVVNALKGSDSQKRIDDGDVINRASAKVVLKEFLTVKTPKFENIPIVGPGMAILGQMIPDLFPAIQAWLDIGTMINTDPSVADVFTDSFLDNILDIFEKDPALNTTEFIDIINSFTTEAWSDLNSLTGLKGKIKGSERTARTFQLYHILAAISDLQTPVMNAIKKDYPKAYIGSNTSVINQLMTWLRKNGIVAQSDSLMDIVGDYKNRLGTIVEAIGINRPKMDPELVQQLIDLIPLPLFSKVGSTFNRDTAAVLGTMLSGDHSFANVINLLNGGQRTSIQTFFKHILNDAPTDLMKYILGVIGADYSETNTVSNAVQSIIDMLKAKVPDYNFEADGSIKMIDQLDKDGNPVVDAFGDVIQTPSVKKDADGKTIMILNPTFSGIGIALEDMYNEGIHSIPKESYESIFKFLFGTIAPMTKMGTISETEVDAAIQGFYDFVTNGAGVHKDANGVVTGETTAGDVSAIIRAVNAIANKEVISPDLGDFIIGIMKKGVGGLTAQQIKPLATILMPKLKSALGFANTMTADRLSEILHRLFTGWSSSADVVKDMGDLIPALATTKIPGCGSAAELLGQVYDQKYNGILVKLISSDLDKITNFLKNGLGGATDDDWGNLVSAVKGVIPIIKGIVPDSVTDMLDTLFNGEDSVVGFQGLGRIFNAGLGKLSSKDISSILHLVNSLNLGFSIPDELVNPLSFLVQNIMSNGIDLSTMDIDTIIKLVEHFAGSGISTMINTINEGNPEAETGEKQPALNPDAFKNLLIDFVVGHKYIGHEGDYAKNRAKDIIIPPEVKLFVHYKTDANGDKVKDAHGNFIEDGATQPSSTIQIPNPKDKIHMINAPNPLYWEKTGPKSYAGLLAEFTKLKTDIDKEDSGFTPAQLFQKLVRMQAIPNEMAQLNHKVDVANAKVKIYFDAAEAFKRAHDQINAVAKIDMDKSLTGDLKDDFEAIRSLFDLLQKELYADSASHTITTMQASKVPVWQINGYKDDYFDAVKRLEDLNKLLTELNTGKISADFGDRMKALFTQINGQFKSHGVVGSLPGIPAWIKTKFDQYIKAHPVGSDTDGLAKDVTHEEGWFFTKTVVDKHACPTTAAASFRGFFIANYEEFFSNANPLLTSKAKDEIQKDVLGGHWKNPYDPVWWIEDPITSLKLSSGENLHALTDRILKALTQDTDKHAFQKIVDMFTKEITK